MAVTPAEAANLFGRSPTWAYRRIYAGDFRPIRYPGRILIPLSELEKFARNTAQHTKRRAGGRRPRAFVSASESPLVEAPSCEVQS
jgi:hypothetical protein